VSNISEEVKKQFLKNLADTLDFIEGLGISEGDAKAFLTDIMSSAPSQSSGTTKYDSLIAYVDGGARGNPGEAGAGAYICDRDGKVVKKLKKYLGTATNNVAEYEALLMALKATRDMGVESLQVFADSELVVKQVLGEYKVKNEALRVIYEKVMVLADGFKEFYISHIPREQNKEADALANKAMDEKK